MTPRIESSGPVSTVISAQDRWLPSAEPGACALADAPLYERGKITSWVASPTSGTNGELFYEEWVCLC